MKRTLIELAVALSAVALSAGQAAAAQTTITDRLSADHTSVEVTGEPAGTVSIGLAVMSNLSGSGLKYLRIPASQTRYTPPAATPVVDMIANDSGGRAIGTWAGRIATTSGGVPVASPSTITDRLSADHTSVEVTGEPAGTVSIGLAVMSNLSGSGLKYLRIPASQTRYTPPAATPVVDMIANDSGGRAIGTWAGRLQTTPPAAAAPPPEVVAPGPSPPPPPPPAPSSMTVSLNAGGWGAGELTDLQGVVSTLRIDTISDSAAATYAKAGYKVIDDMSGPYNTAGVSGIEAHAWAANALARWKADPNITAIEITNEPGGSWFWGSNATSSTNVAAYASLLRVVYEAFAPYGSARPKLLASYDGGGVGESQWGAQWFKQVDPRWIDGVTVHPYGGTSNRTASALGNRANVERAHSETGLPVWVTEVGWPTAIGQPATGDSLQWSEAEQAANITSFVKWCRSLGYVADVTIFGYRDYGSNAFYGIETESGKRKLSYGAVKTLSAE